MSAGSTDRKERGDGEVHVQVSYTTEGVGSVLKEGGSGRKAMVEDLVAGVGGTLEVFYFSFGEDDAIVIADLPDNITAAAISMRVGAAGAAEVATTPLLTPDEVDQATKLTVAYRAPGA